MLLATLNLCTVEEKNISKSLLREVVKFYFLPNISDLPNWVWKFSIEVAMEKVTFMYITKVVIVRSEKQWHFIFIFRYNILRFTSTIKKLIIDIRTFSFITFLLENII